MLHLLANVIEFVNNTENLTWWHEDQEDICYMAKKLHPLDRTVFSHIHKDKIQLLFTLF